MASESSGTPRRAGILAAALCAGLLSSPAALAQEHHEAAADPQEHGEHQEAAGGHEAVGRHRFVIFTGNTFVPAGSSDGSDTILVPTLGLDYSYWVSPKLGFGVVADMEFASYVVETERGHGQGTAGDSSGTGTVERERAVIIAALVLWEPVHRLGIFAGPGREFEKNESFWLFRIGVEYAFPLPKQWSIVPAVIYDYKDVYDAWSFGVAFAKRFGPTFD